MTADVPHGVQSAHSAPEFGSTFRENCPPGALVFPEEHTAPTECSQNLTRRRNFTRRRQEKKKTHVKQRLTNTAGFPSRRSGLWRNHNTVINSYSPHKHACISWRCNWPSFSCNLLPYLLFLSDIFSRDVQGGAGGVVEGLCVCV